MTSAGKGGPSLEVQIAAWRDYTLRRRAIVDADVDELEDHLRDEIAGLVVSGLAEDEAFLIAIKRLGSLDELSHEYAREHSDRLWKQLVLGPEPDGLGARTNLDAMVALACAVGAAAAITVPTALGLSVDHDPGVYARNLSLFVLPFLAGYFAWKRQVRGMVLGFLLAVFLLAAVLVNVYPFSDKGSTEILVAIHLPVVLWTVVGVAYAGGDWRSPDRRMDFIRFTGEWFVYYALIALGGAVLTAVSVGVFQAIGLNLEGLVNEWLLPAAAAGAVIVAAWLVEAKQSVVENMAPVLAKVFIPLFAVMLVAFLVAITWTFTWSGDGIDIGREILILFDVLLILVLGLLLYAISAREPQAPAGLFDRLQLLLVVSALLVDALVLGAMISRISSFGVSPNRVASLGLNLVLLANLTWSARLSLRFLRGRGPHSALERWQTSYLPVFAVWAAAVVVIFPPAFDFQ